jgi:hypothetical protein
VAVEHEFGRLKDDYGLLPLRVRGLERVQRHADLTMLARLSLAFVPRTSDTARRVAALRSEQRDADSVLV